MPDVGEGWSLGRPVRALASARRRPARAARRQVRAPGQVRTGNPPQRTRELANARAASGHEHQGDEAKPRGLIRRTSNLGTCAVQGEDRPPNRHRESLMSPGTYERLRRPFGILRDRLRRHLTEPVRRGLRIVATHEGHALHVHLHLHLHKARAFFLLTVAPDRPPSL
jgi:hypothetical protein